MTVVMKAGDESVSVDESVGGKVTSLVAGGAESIARTDTGLDPVKDVTQFGSFLMIPVAGRLDEGRLPWEGEVHEMPKDFFGHAIHGVGFDKPWNVDESSESSVVLSLDLGAAGWPFGGTARHR